MLTNLEGSSAKAKASMAWVTDFAERTPYDVAQVMEAFTRLRGAGIDPTTGALQSLGDGAAGAGKELVDAIEMIKDAQRGSNERLAEFNIGFKDAGDQIAFSYEKAGKAMTVMAKKGNAGDIRRALFGVMDDQYGGMMLAQAKTFDGIWGGILDKVTNFQRMVADAGVFAFVKSELLGVGTTLDGLKGSKGLQGFATLISDSLITVLKRLKELILGVDWPKFIAGVTAAALGIVAFSQGVGKFVDAIGGLNGLVSLVAGVAMAGMIQSMIAFGVAIGFALGPVTLVVGAIALLAAGAYALIRNWDKVTGFFEGMWSGIKRAFTTGVSDVWNSFPDWFRGVLKGTAFVLRVGAMTSPAALAANAVGRVAAGGERPSNQRPTGLAANAVGRAAAGGERPFSQRPTGLAANAGGTAAAGRERPFPRPAVGLASQRERGGFDGRIHVTTDPGLRARQAGAVKTTPGGKVEMNVYRGATRPGGTG